jgi:DNA-binding MarR family transcriptional regulator
MGEAATCVESIWLTQLMVRVVNDSLTTANRLRPVLLRLARHLRRETHSVGVTGGQVSLLIAIKKTPGITASALAEAERVSAPAMSAHLGRLEGARLIRRERGTDRRRVGLFVTEEGDRVLRSVRKSTAWLSSRLDRLSEHERAAVDAALPALERLLEDRE